MWQPVPIPVLDLYPELRARLLDLLRELGPELWQRPTVSRGWTVKDVALHLLGGDIANISRRRDGLTDALAVYAPSGADLTDTDALAAAINRWNEDWVRAARRTSPRLLIELLAITGEALHAHLCGLDLRTIGEPVSWAGPEPAPVWLDVAREYTEQWTHQAQIRDAVGAPPLQERRLFAPVLATFMHALPRALRSVDAPIGTSLRVVVTGESGGVWRAIRQDSGWSLDLERQPGELPTATAILDQDTAWRLFTRGLTRDQAAQLVQLSGRRSLAAKVFDVVAIIG